MTQPEEPKGKIIQIVMGTRIDHVPAPETQQYFSYLCMECRQETVTETEYPEGTSVVCNVCAPVVSDRLAKEHDAAKVLDMPPEGKARMIEIAHRQGVPVETLIKEFYAWRTGKQMSTSVYNQPKKDKR